MITISDIMEGCLEEEEVGLNHVICPECNSSILLKAGDDKFCPLCIINELKEEVVDLSGQIDGLEDLLAADTDAAISKKLAMVGEKLEAFRGVDMSLRGWIDLHNTLPDAIDDLLLIYDDEYDDEYNDLGGTDE